MRRPVSALLAVLAILSSLFVAAVPAAVGAVTVYVDAATGSNAYTYEQAQDPATPWATLNQAVATVLAGDRIVVAPGSYALSTGRDFSPGIVLEGPRGAAGAQVDVDLDGASGITMIGFYHSAQLDLENSTDIAIKDGDVVGDSIEIAGSSNVLIEGMYLTQAGKAIRIVPGSNVTIRHNFFTGYRIDGIFINGGADILVENNTFDDNGPATGEPNDVHSDVLQGFSAGFMNLTFRNNIVVRNANVLMILGSTGVNRGLVIEDNYFADNNGFAVQLAGVQDAILRNNIYICNGANFRTDPSVCTNITGFDLKTENSTFTRINDPANATGSAITAEPATGGETEASPSGEGSTTSPDTAGPLDGPGDTSPAAPPDGPEAGATSGDGTVSGEATVTEGTGFRDRWVRTFRLGTRTRRGRG